MIVKFLGNRWTQLAISLVALYFAFHTYDFREILDKARRVPIWYVGILIIYTFGVGFLACIRWCLILNGKLDKKILWQMYKGSNMGSFYSMFLPTPLAGDGFKFVNMLNKFNIPRGHILASVLVDRVLGISTLVFTGFLGILMSGFLKINLAWQTKFISFILFLGLILFYVLLAIFDFHRYKGKNRWLDKFIEIDKAFRHERGDVLVKAGIVSVFAQFTWMLPVAISSRFFGVNLNIIHAYVVLPIISLLLSVPLTFGGFGAREAAYVYFLGSLGYNQTGLLALSAFNGVMGLVIAFLSGIFVLL